MVVKHTHTEKAGANILRYALSNDTNYEFDILTYPVRSYSSFMEASICCLSCEGLVRIEVVVLITCRDRTTPTK